MPQKKISSFKRVPVGIVVALVALTAAISISVSYQTAIRQTNAKLQDINERQAMFSKLSEIDTLARGVFYGQIDEEKLNEALARGYAEGLGDEQIFYLAAEDAKAYQTYAENAIEPISGIGAEVVQADDGALRVVAVYDGSGAQEAGLLIGDEITGINGKETAGLAYSAAWSSLNQPEGTEIELTVRRGSAEKTETQSLSIQVTCSNFKAQTVSASVLDKNVGYLSLARLRSETGKELESNLNTLREQGAAAWVIDLRGCVGTDESAAAAVADLLLGTADTVRAENRSGEIETLRQSNEKAIEGKVVCLVDGETTGTAEVLAGALQDAGCTVVGQTTAGNAVRTIFSRLSDGSGIVLPVGYYVRADGSRISGAGVTPDTAAKLNEEQTRARRYGKLDVKQDAQVQQACKAALG